MALNIEIPHPKTLKPKITIFGVGGAGGNAVNNMIRSSLAGVDFVIANTDAQAIENSLSDNKIQLGVATTKGLGAGSFPDRGRAAAEENIEEIEKFLEGSHMVFIAAGMGGGTGTGAAPVIAKLAKERDILTVGVVTKPFHFEGKYRMDTADKGIEELKRYVDTLIVIPNQNLFRIANEHTTFESAFKMADDVLHAGVRGITDLITMPGLVNLDFADIRTIMTKMGKAMMGTGEAEGENRAVEACEAAISNPLLDDISIKGAKGVLVNMTGGPDMTLFEADLAVNTIKREVDNNANIIFGSAFDENMKGKIRVSVVATGIDEDEYKAVAPKTQTHQEPSKFRSEIVSNTSKESSSNKTFFDPGIAAEVEEERVEEINEKDFKAKKTYLKEENVNYGKADNSHAKKQALASVAFSQISFLENEEDVSSISSKPTRNDNEEFEKTVKVKKPAISKTEKEKKDQGGFSLFGFMSSAKKEEPKREEDFEPEEEEIETKTVKQQKSKEELQNLSKKKQEFFGSTILDETVQENNPEDDILNVPAFFRKKKNG